MSRLRGHDDTTPWRGAYAPYDLVKELCIAVGAIGLLAVLLTVLFSSPDEKPSTIAQWSRSLPVNFVATAAKENNASLWDVTTGRRIGLPLVHPGVVFAESFSPDGKTLVTGCLDGGVRLWDVASGKRVGAILRHEEKVHSAVFSRDGRLVLSSSEDGTARLWEAATGRLVGQQLSHSSELRNAVFSPDQTHILTAGFEGTARLWRLAPEQALAKVLQQPGAVVAARTRTHERPDRDWIDLVHAGVSRRRALGGARGAFVRRLVLPTQLHRDAGR